MWLGNHQVPVRPPVANNFTTLAHILSVTWDRDIPVFLTISTSNLSFTVCLILCSCTVAVMVPVPEDYDPSTGLDGRGLNPQQSRRRPLYLSQLESSQPTGRNRIPSYRSQSQADQTHEPESHAGAYETLDGFGDLCLMKMSLGLTNDPLDRALLAEPAQDRTWQAAHGLTRLSLPPRSLTSSILNGPCATPTLIASELRHSPDQDTRKASILLAEFGYTYTLQSEPVLSTQVLLLTSEVSQATSFLIPFLTYRRLFSVSCCSGSFILFSFHFARSFKPFLPSQPT